jgi:hypothetical protein
LAANQDIIGGRRLDPRPWGRIQTQVHDVTVPEFEHAPVDVLLAEAGAEIERWFQLVDKDDSGFPRGGWSGMRDAQVERSNSNTVN